MKNYMEILVDEIYNEVKGLYVDCDTINCSHDIKAEALNNLPTAYFSHDMSEGEKKAFLVERQRRISVLAKIAEAADEICGKCTHGKR
jgi:competence protein ComFB